MKVAFTLCSNNYLAQAKSLGDSLKEHNPEYIFVIGLVDQFSEDVDYRFFEPYEIIPIENIKIIGFDDMVYRYDIIELNTAVKPFLFNYLLERDSSIEFIFYIDPDIFVYKPFSEIEECLIHKNIILTPHFFTPIYDNFHLAENDILNTGLYNLGFLALRRSNDTSNLLKWWMIKLKDQCLINFNRGLFVDQLWMNFVPLYYDNVLIYKHLGCNVAYWNLHERMVSKIGDNFLINDKYNLVFFHFSGFQFNSTGLISKYQNRYSLEQRPDILPLFAEYREIIFRNRHSEFALVPCYYVKLKEDIERKRRILEMEEERNSTSSMRRLGRAVKFKIKKKLDILFS